MNATQLNMPLQLCAEAVAFCAAGFLAVWLVSTPWGERAMDYSILGVEKTLATATAVASWAWRAVRSCSMRCWNSSWRWVSRSWNACCCFISHRCSHTASRKANNDPMKVSSIRVKSSMGAEVNAPAPARKPETEAA